MFYALFFVDSSYVNVTVSNGVPVMLQQHSGDISSDSDEETDRELLWKFPTQDDEDDEEYYPAEEYDSVGPSNGLSRSQLMQMRQ